MPHSQYQVYVISTYRTADESTCRGSPRSPKSTAEIDWSLFVLQVARSRFDHADTRGGWGKSDEQANGTRRVSTMLVFRFVSKVLRPRRITNFPIRISLRGSNELLVPGNLPFPVALYIINRGNRSWFDRNSIADRLYPLPQFLAIDIRKYILYSRTITSFRSPFNFTKER